MGDRGNIVIERDSDAFPHPLFMYTHWRGSELLSILQAALLRGKDRWQDGQYLPRIIFSEMIKDSVLYTTGYGLSTAVGDGSHKLLCVNIVEQKVKERESAQDPDSAIEREWSFEEFVNAKFD